jgi:hypothetical protein
MGRSMQAEFPARGISIEIITKDLGDRFVNPQPL